MPPRGHFYVRLEDTEWKFIRRLEERRPFHGAIVKAPFLAQYPSEDRRHGEQADRLTEALSRRGFQWALDPATAPHAHKTAAEWTTGRTRACTLAAALPLPWDPAHLQHRSDTALDLLSRADVLQRGSPAFAIPYFEIDCSDDTCLRANCNLINMGIELAGDRRPLAYLQALRRELRSGAAADAARRIIAAGAQTVMIRIRRFEHDVLEDVIAYLDLIDVIDREGARPVADCVGTLGPVLIAGGSDAFTSGARYYLNVPKALLQPRPERDNKEEDEEDGDKNGGGVPIRYLVPGSLSMVDAGDVDSALPPCAIEGCRALEPNARPRDRREHNLHEYKNLAEEAAAAGLGYADVLRSHPGALPRLWATALDSCAAQRRAA